MSVDVAPAPASATGARAPVAEPAHPATSRRTTSLVTGLVVAVVLLGVVVVMSLAYGSRATPLSTPLDMLLGYDAIDNDHLAVLTVRLPRTVIGLLVGASLGLAGAVIQGVTRNPLADPGLLGVNAGAAFGIVVAISVLSVTTPSGYVLFGILGAAIASAVVFVIASIGRDGATPVKLALAGAALTAVVGSLTTAVLLSDQATFDQYRFWAVGTLSGRDLDDTAALAPFFAVGMVAALASGRMLNGLAMGEDLARALGHRIGWSRALAGVSVMLLCGTATSLAGPIAFIGLTVPHLARFIAGPDYRWVLPYSMLLAPILLLTADVLGRLVPGPGELQVGIVVAFLGGPVFIALVRRRRVAEL